jgi:hypothetical protein
MGDLGSARVAVLEQLGGRASSAAACDAVSTVQVGP